MTCHIRVPARTTEPVSWLRSGCPCTQTVTSLRSRYSSGINPRSIELLHFGQIDPIEVASRCVTPVTAGCTCVPQSGQNSASAGSGCLHIAHWGMIISFTGLRLILTYAIMILEPRQFAQSLREIRRQQRRATVIIDVGAKHLQEWVCKRSGRDANASPLSNAMEFHRRL